MHAKIRLFLEDCLLCFHGGSRECTKQFFEPFDFLKSVLSQEKASVWELYVMTSDLL